VRNDDGHEPGRVDWLDLGPDPDEGVAPRDPRRRYLWYGVAAGLVVVALVLTRTQHGANRAASSPTSPVRTPTSSSPSPTVPESSGSFVDPAAPSLTVPPDGLSTGPTVAIPRLGPPKVTSLGHPLLDVPADWELFALGSGVLVRIQLALGRITTTPVPVVSGDVPTMLLVGSDRAFVSALDNTTSYVVRDGKQPADLPATLRNGASMWPGPDQQHLWTSRTDGDPTGMALVNLDGEPTGVTIDVPELGSVQGPDGAGYLLVTGVGGLYDARPGKVHRVTSGILRASGPTRWLAIECDDSFSCAHVVIDRATRAHHRLSRPVDFNDLAPGTISPDGKTAALQSSNNISGSGIRLLDLDSGADRPVAVTPNSTGTPWDPPWVWSPDSRWLFVTDAGGRVIIINRGTGRAAPLQTQLAQVTQLALRHS
jgi:hypothetical protein